MPTNVPPLQFTPEGIAIPEEKDIVEGVLEDFKNAFGPDMDTSLTTPQGQLATSIAAIIGDCNDRIAEMVNQFDPLFASGRNQRALGEFYFLTPTPAESTVLQVNCIGAGGVVIPQGSQIIDPQGVIYQSTGAGTIPSSGSIVLQFAAVTAGPLAVPDSVSISRSIPGWDRAVLISGTEGQYSEGQGEFELRRQQSVASNSSGTVEAVRAAVSAVEGVLDVFVVDNSTKAIVNYGATNYPLLENSIYVGVIGGNATEIAEAIASKKDAGANMNGNQTVTIYDTVHYDPPYPGQIIKYNIPTNTPIYFAVQIANNSSLPSNIAQLVKDSIVDAFAGGDGRQRARMGASLFASRFYSPISAISNSVEILSVLIGKTSPAALNAVTLGIDQAPTINPANITVTIV